MAAEETERELEDDVAADADETADANESADADDAEADESADANADGAAEDDADAEESAETDDAADADAVASADEELGEDEPDSAPPPSDADEPSSARPAVDGMAAGEPRPRRSLGAALLGLVVGLGLGTAGGVWAGPYLWPRSLAPAAGECPSATGSAGTAAPAPPTTALAIDLGTLPENATLEGTWNPRSRMDDRDVAITTGQTARIVLSAAVDAPDQVLAFVAKAVGIKMDSNLDVSIALQENEAVKTRLRPRWSLQSVPVPPELRGQQKLTIDLAIAGWADLVDKDGTGPGIAVDQLFIGAIRPTARLDLRSTAGRSGLLEGFYAVEGPGCDEPWAWSKGLRSVVGLLLDPVSGGYQLRVHAAVFDQLAPLKVTARVNDKDIGTMEIGELQEYALSVPDDILTTGANLVEFRYPRSARPSEVVKGSKDERELAMRLYTVGLGPTSH